MTFRFEHVISLAPELMDVLQSAGSSQIEAKLDQIIQQQEQLRMTQVEELALLKAIDDATTAIGTNVQAVANNVQIISETAGVISSEMDALRALIGDGAGPEVESAMSSLKSRVDALQGASQLSADALAAQVPVLKAIATKGAATPVPVPVPPPVV